MALHRFERRVLAVSLSLFPRYVVLLAILLLCSARSARADAFDTLRGYWVGTLTNGSGASSITSTANSYWSTMDTNASRSYLWSNLPLGSDSSDITSTFSQLEAMALAWATPGSSLYGNSSLAAAVAGGMDWMVANAYTPTGKEYDNWWDWEIGGPQAFNNAAALLYPALTATEVTNYGSAVDHFGPTGSGATYGWMTGANLTDKCKVVLIRAIIGKNSTLMTSGQTNLSPVFPYVTNSDGFYTDGSFIQHSVIAYTGTYGNVLLSDIGQLVNLLNGSTWQITDPNLTNVYNWVSDSFEPLVYNGAMMDMVRGRAISREYETEFSDGGSTISSARSIAQFAPAATAAALTNWANSPQLPPGQFQFADMDRVVALRSGFGLGLSLSSSRIANYESINGENLHGWFTGDGMTYLYLGGTDTQFTGDYWPTVDPYHLPGTTVEVFTRTNSIGEGTTTGQTWVGGAQVAKTYGAAGMSIAPYATTLTGKKSWFMFDNEIVCLGAGITCGGGYEIDTTVEDRRLGAPATNNFTLNGTTYSPVIGWSNSPASASWCALQGVAGYYFPGGASNLTAAFVSSTGSWYQINTGYSSTSLTDDYLKLWFNHGVKPTNNAYVFVILPNATAASMSTYATNPDVVVLTNTATVQAASKPALSVTAANFWVDGTNFAGLITVNRKASVITSENISGLSVGIADPTQTNSGSITVILNRSATGVASADPGVTVVQLSPQVIISVDVNGSLGKSYQAVLTYPPPALTWDANTGSGGTHPLDGTGYWDFGSWWTGSADVSWSDATPYSAIIGAGGTAGKVTLLNPHTATSLTFNPVATGAYTVAGAASLTLTNGITANASATVAAPLVLAANQTWTVASNRVLTVSGALSGPGVLILDATNGTLVLNGTNSNTGSTVLNGGTVLINGATGTNNFTVTAEATLGGTGTVNGPVSVSGVIAPGNSGVGTLTTGGEVWNSGGTYQFNVNNATNGSGRDFLAINGALNLQSALGGFGGGEPFYVNLVSLTASNSPGPVPGFANTVSNSWVILTASGGISNYAPTRLLLRTTAFSNAFTGTFNLGTNGNSLVVTCTPPLVVTPVLNSWANFTPGGFNLSFTGTNGQTYRVLATTNLLWPLTNWLVLTSGVFGSGTASFTDSAATNPEEYYRVTSP